MKAFAHTPSLAVALFAASLVNAKKCVHRPSHTSPGASNVPPVYTDYITSSAPMTYMTATTDGASGLPTTPVTTATPSPSQPPPYSTLTTANMTTAYDTTSYIVQTSVATSAVSTGVTSLTPNYSTTVPMTTITQNQTTLECTNSSTCTDTTHHSSSSNISTPSLSTTASTSFGYTTVPDKSVSSIALTSNSDRGIPSWYTPPPMPYTFTLDTQTTDNGEGMYSTIPVPYYPRPTIYTDTAQYY
ncbi:hypothetical protein GGI13_000174 [Coemansia sp. RSA 455]|nr:hypothetical protein GGI13_000174 [Coemansia sp. RSA 455]